MECCCGIEPPPDGASDSLKRFLRDLAVHNLGIGPAIYEVDAARARAALAGDGPISVRLEQHRAIINKWHSGRRACWVLGWMQCHPDTSELEATL